MCPVSTDTHCNFQDNLHHNALWTQMNLLGPDGIGCGIPCAIPWGFELVGVPPTACLEVGVIAYELLYITLTNVEVITWDTVFPQSDTTATVHLSYGYYSRTASIHLESYKQWKALKCQTLSAAVHVIVLMCWLESITVSWLSNACHAHCCVPTSFTCALFCSDALSQALRNLSLAFLVDFTLSDSTAVIRFIAFSHKLHSAFCLDRKTWSQGSHVFRLTGTAALHCGDSFVGGILTANGQKSTNSQRTPLPRTKWPVLSSAIVCKRVHVFYPGLPFWAPFGIWLRKYGRCSALDLFKKRYQPLTWGV